MSLFSPTNEAERKKFYRWNKKGIFKRVKLQEKPNSGRPKNYYMISLDYFKKNQNNLDAFLETIKEMKKYIPIAVGLPFSLMYYNYLQICSVYVYTYSENLRDVKEILSNYDFISIREAPKIVIERRINYKKFPLLSLEDTILTAIKDAQNLMVAFVLLITQRDKINYTLLFREMQNQKINMNVFLSLLKNKYPLFAYYNQSLDSSELNYIKNASKSLLQSKYNWETSLFLLKSKFRFINKLRNEYYG